MRKRFAFIGVALMMMLLLFAKTNVRAAGVVASKTEGTVTWTLYDDGLLDIKGRGLVLGPNYDDAQSLIESYGPNGNGLGYGYLFGNEADYKNYKNLVKKAVVSSGIVDLAKTFYVFENLESVSLPSGMEYIRDDTFLSCKSLTTINLPDTIYSIGNYAFSHCKSLKSVTIPKNAGVGRGAFSNCSNLESVTFSGDYTGTSAFGSARYQFESCIKLNDIIAPEKVYNEIVTSPKIMAGTPWCLQREAPVTGYLDVRGGKETQYTIDKDGNCTITGTGKVSSFSFDGKLGEYKCMIKTVTFSESLTQFLISNYFFQELENLEKVVNKSDVRMHFSDGANDEFSWCYETNKEMPIFELPKGTAVKVRPKLKDSISLEFDNNGATSGTVQADNFAPGKRLNIINTLARKGYKFLHWEYTIGNNTYTTSYNALDSDRNELALNNVKILKLKAVWEKLDKDELSASDYLEAGERITDEAGNDTGYVVTANYKKGTTVKYAGSDADKKKKTLKIKKTINGSDYLKYSVTSIEKKAFKGNKYLKELTIPNSVTSIGASAFESCKKLKKITINTGYSTVKVGKNAFKKLPKGAVITVKGPNAEVKKKLVKALKKNTNAKVKQK